MKMIGSSQVDYKEEVVRRLVSPKSLTVSQDGEVYRGYGGNADMTTYNAVARIAERLAVRWQHWGIPGA